MKNIAVVDYGMCNLDSIARAIALCGGNPVVTDKYRDINQADAIIFPGVGAFPKAMENIKNKSLDKILYEQVIERNIPFLGICLGMQLLATKGWEISETEGLGWISGEVKRLEPRGFDSRIPHVGWNEVHLVRESHLFRNIPSGKDFYFVHSYHFCVMEDDVIVARTIYGDGFVSVVQKGLIFGVQFHPEKSLRFGFQLIKNFLDARDYQ